MRTRHTQKQHFTGIAFALAAGLLLVGCDRPTAEGSDSKSQQNQPSEAKARVAENAEKAEEGKGNEALNVLHETLLAEHKPQAEGGFSHSWVIYTERQESQSFVVLNGRRLGPFERVSDLYRFSKDGRHVAFAALKDKKWEIFLDGESKWTHDELYWGEYTWTKSLDGNQFQMQTPAVAFFFTPLASRLVYGIKTGEGKWSVAVNGKPSTQYHSVSIASLAFAGDEPAYAAWPEDTETRVFVAGDKTLGPYQTSMRPTITEDGAHFCFSATRDGKSVMVIDGVEDRGDYEEIGGYSISANGKVAFIFKQGDKWKLRFNGQTLPDDYEEIYWRFIEISPDGTNVAFWAKSSGQWRVCTMTSHYKGYDGYFSNIINGTAYGLFWGADSKHLAYLCRTTSTSSGDPRLCFDGENLFDIPSLSDSDPGALVQWLVLKGNKVPVPESVVFVSGRMAYTEKKAGSDQIEFVFGEERQGPYEEASSVVVSPDKQHYLYSAKAQGKSILVFDGKRIGTYDALYRLSFIENGEWGALGARDGQLYGLGYRYSRP